MALLKDRTVQGLLILAIITFAAAFGLDVKDRSQGVSLDCASLVQGRVVIRIDDHVWSNASVTRARAHNAWCSASDGSLSPVGQPQSGTGKDVLGEYEFCSLEWTCTVPPNQASPSAAVRFVTSWRRYSLAGNGGDTVVFKQEWPEGASGMAFVCGTF